MSEQRALGLYCLYPGLLPHLMLTERYPRPSARAEAGSGRAMEFGIHSQQVSPDADVTGRRLLHLARPPPGPVLAVGPVGARNPRDPWGTGAPGANTLPHTPTGTMAGPTAQPGGIPPTSHAGGRPGIF